MCVPLIHAYPFHRHSVRLVAGVVAVNQFIISVQKDFWGKSAVPKTFIMCFSATGNNFQQEQAGGFVFQMNRHSAVKGWLCEWNNRLGIIIQCGIFIHLYFNSPGCCSFVHFMNFFKGLWQYFQVCPFFYMVKKILRITCHDSGGGTERHDLDAAVLSLKRHHDFIWSCKRQLLQNSLSIF